MITERGETRNAIGINSFGAAYDDAAGKRKRLRASTWQ